MKTKGNPGNMEIHVPGTSQVERCKFRQCPSSAEFYVIFCIMWPLQKAVFICQVVGLYAIFSVSVPLFPYRPWALTPADAPQHNTKTCGKEFLMSSFVNARGACIHTCANTEYALEELILKCGEGALRGSGKALRGLVTPYRAILRYYRCDTPYRVILFRGG